MPSGAAFFVARGGGARGEVRVGRHEGGAWRGGGARGGVAVRGGVRGEGCGARGGEAGWRARDGEVRVGDFGIFASLGDLHWQISAKAAPFWQVSKFGRCSAGRYEAKNIEQARFYGLKRGKAFNIGQFEVAQTCETAIKGTIFMKLFLRGLPNLPIYPARWVQRASGRRCYIACSSRRSFLRATIQRSPLTSARIR